MRQPTRGPRLVGFGAVIVIITVAAACSPLPGDAVDPLYLRHGNKPAAAPPASAPAAPATAGAPSVPSRTAAVPPAIGERIWIGRYRDSRGGGEVTFSLVQREAMVTGIWKLRTGGGGPVSGSIDPSAGRLQLRMENTAPECPGKFEGWAEVRESTLTGAYHGTDCEGTVSDGWLELHAK